MFWRLTIYTSLKMYTIASSNAAIFPFQTYGTYLKGCLRPDSPGGYPQSVPVSERKCLVQSYRWHPSAKGSERTDWLNLIWPYYEFFVNEDIAFRKSESQIVPSLSPGEFRLRSTMLSTAHFKNAALKHIEVVICLRHFISQVHSEQGETWVMMIFFKVPYCIKCIYSILYSTYDLYISNTWFIYVNFSSFQL